MVRLPSVGRACKTGNSTCKVAKHELASLGTVERRKSLAEGEHCRQNTDDQTGVGTGSPGPEKLCTAPPFW